MSRSFISKKNCIASIFFLTLSFSSTGAAFPGWAPAGLPLFQAAVSSFPDSEDIIHFAAATDQHYGNKDCPIPPYDSDTIEDWMNHPDLPEFDFTIASVGDWICDDRIDEWEDIDYCWQAITQYNADRHKIPYFWVFGNHDITNYGQLVDGNPVWKERVGRSISGLNENNYAFLYNNVLFICAAETNNLFHLSGFQRSWIEYLVSRFPDKTTVILAHQATYRTTGEGDSQATSWSNWDYRYHNDISWWYPLFWNNPQIKLYIHGHNEKGYNTVVLNLHPQPWDDNCTFVLVPSNGKNYGQYSWSYIFTIADTYIRIKLWDSENHCYAENEDAGVPYEWTGLDNNVTDEGMEWFSIPKRVLDGQNWTWLNRMVAERYTVELVGSQQTEQIDNPELDGCDESDEGGDGTLAYWYGVRGDSHANNKETGEADEYISIDGGNTLELAMSATCEETGCPPGGFNVAYIEGKVPYNTAIAVPGKTYIFSCRIKTVEGTGSVDYSITIPQYLDITNFVWENQPILSDAAVPEEFSIISQEFTLPDDPSMWFIQPRIYFDPGATYILDSWSLKMAGDSGYTEDFSVTLNGELHAALGTLDANEYASFTLGNTTMGNELHFSCTIEGNRVGLLRLVYEKPQLWSDDVSIGIETPSQNQIYVEDVSPFNARTSIMSFEGSHYEILAYGFYQEVVRGKKTFFHNLNDSSINGSYPLTDTVITTRYGNVGKKYGPPQNVLFINNSQGNQSRVLTLLAGQSITLSMEPSPYGPEPGDFVLYLILEEADADDLTPHPYGIGTACFPTPISKGNIKAPPYTLVNTFDYRALGVPYLTGQSPAPWSRFFPSGFPKGCYTFQGILMDNGSLCPFKISLTNAIVLKIL